MAKKDDKATQSESKRGGLGRGLGALIPSAPLSGGAGKGHFWSALDNPPPPADGALTPTDVTLPNVSRETPDSESEPSANPPRSSDSSPTQPASSDVSRETSETTPEASALEEALDAAISPPESSADDSMSPTHVPASSADLSESLSQVSRETSIGAGHESSGAAESHTSPANPSTTPSPSSEPAAVLVEVHPDDITANPKNPRQVFDEDELAELAESVREFGLLQPIVVRRLGNGALELVMGERRLRAARLAELPLIPVIVRQTDDDAMLRDALLENIHRVQLHPLEEAAAYQQLIDEFGVTHDELAQRIKRSRPAITNTIRLMKLPTRVQNRVAAGVISGSHARALLALDSSEEQEALATRIVSEGLSVRATEELVTLASGSQTKKRTARRRNFTAPALSGLADRLSDHFDTRALVQLGRTKGKIVVEFASVDDLERIVAMMAPHLKTQRLREEIVDEPRED